jgi:hypothetical protein
VKKAELKERMINIDQNLDKSAFIYEGTTIIQINNKRIERFENYRESYGIPAFVVRTNFVTLKGQLIRIILFPK